MPITYHQWPVRSRTNPSHGIEDFRTLSKKQKINLELTIIDNQIDANCLKNKSLILIIFVTKNDPSPLEEVDSSGSC